MKSVDLIISSFRQLLSLSLLDIKKVGDEVPIPRFKESTLKDLIDEVLKTYSNPLPVVQLLDPVVVVGDLHGHLHDLLRIFCENGLPPKTSYLFLGDYVDRGDYSLEVITILLAFRTVFPNNICLLRGNHEVSSVNALYGFKQEIVDIYGSPFIWNIMNDIFIYFPFAAVISKDIFCVHGGISQYFVSIADIMKIQMPALRITDEANDLLWSDPNMEVKSNKFTVNKRGRGCSFNRQATREFLAINKMTCIIRGHQCMKDGIEKQHEGDVITVFSASDYAGNANLCGYIVINNTIFYHTIDSAEMIKRTEASFFDVIPQNDNVGIFNHTLISSISALTMPRKPFTQKRGMQHGATSIMLQKSVKRITPLPKYVSHTPNK